ncbi:hypothetical protein GCM10010232_70370 [Streptomyces amakusaensis]
MARQKRVHHGRAEQARRDGNRAAAQDRAEREAALAATIGRIGPGRSDSGTGTIRTARMPSPP